MTLAATLALGISILPLAQESGSDYSRRLLDSVFQGSEKPEIVIRERPDVAFEMFHFYMDRCLIWKQEGKLKRAQQFRGFAQKLSVAFDEAMGGDRLSRAWKRYERWTGAQGIEKIAADRTYARSAAAFEGENYVEAGRAAHAAIAKFQTLEDRRSEARAWELLAHIPPPETSQDQRAEYFDSAAKLFSLAGDDWRAIRATEARAHLLRASGARLEAASAYEKIMKQAQALGLWESEIGSRYRLGALRLQLGEYEAGCRDLLVCEEAFAKDERKKELLLDCIEMRAAASVDFGRYGEAVRSFSRVETMLGEHGDRKRLSRWHLRLGGAYDEIGRHRRAREHLLQAQKIAQETAAPNIEALAFEALARVELNQTRTAAALEYIRRARAAIAVGDRSRARQARLEAQARVQEGKTSEAIRLLELAAKLQSAVADPLEASLTFIALARALILTDRPNDAARHLDAAAQLSSSPEIVWRIRFLRGEISAANGDLDLAAREYEQAIEIGEMMWLDAEITPLRGSFFATRLEPYHRLVELKLSQDRIDEALSIAQRSRARALAAHLSPLYRKTCAEIPRQLLLKKERITRSLRSLAGASSKAIQRKLDVLRGEYRDLLTALELEAPKTRRLWSPPEIAPRDYVRKLQSMKEKKALAVYSSTAATTHLWVISSRGVRYHDLGISSKDLARQVDTIRKPFIAFRDGRVDLSNLAFDTEAARKLFDALLLPAMDELKNAKHLIIVPDGSLHHLPFEALVTGGQRGPVNHRELFSEYASCRYVVDRWTVSYLPGLSLLGTERDQVEDTKVLVLADPAFDGRPNSELRSRRDTSLPSATEEARGIRDLFGEKRSEVLTGSRATETALRKRMASASTIHFATHAWVEDRAPLFSAIRLAASGTDDGALEVHEILELDLRGKLVVLSACETARGPLRRGEGIESLARSFLLAGARASIGTLWRVDSSASPLMIEFYRARLEGLSPAQSLRRAKIHLLRELRGPGHSYALPYFWAPFILTGHPD